MSINHRDVDECALSNGGCLEVCENTVGSYFCACDGDERLLSGDGKTCMGEFDREIIHTGRASRGSFFAIGAA